MILRPTGSHLGSHLGSLLGSLLGALALLACGGDDTSSSSGGGASPTAPSFTPDTAGAGARLYLQAEPVAGTTRLSLSLVAEGLGDVLGWSAHLVYDPEAVRVEDLTIRAEVMGEADEIVALDRPAAGDRALACTRISHALGGVSLTAPTALASFTAELTAGSSSRLSLTPVVVRGPEGDYLPALGEGGVIDGGSEGAR
ncbi:MAG: hypothetical protein R3B72_34295 [Polyangiaceae bacterium]